VKRERGQALIETILIGLILFVPLFWLLGVLSDMHRGALATASAVRDAGSEMSIASDMLSGTAAMDSAISQALTDQGLDPNGAEVRVSAPNGVARGARVTIEVSVPVQIAQAPLLGEAPWGPKIWIRSSLVTTVERYASRP
jgi:hypothetical protein